MLAEFGSAPKRQITALRDFLKAGRNLLVISGAGISTDSGIPDYRDKEGSWKHARPIQHQDFMGQLKSRKRYWARSMLGWPHFAKSEPNQAHLALTTLQREGYIGHIVTQNVDRLHQKAGSRDVVDLHGRLDQVVCMDCKQLFQRQDLQSWLTENNPGWQQKVVLAPDGDAKIEGSFDSFQIPECFNCAGVLKPNVVFYGDNVPKPTVQHVFDQVADCDGVLIVGSSLMVFSGFRFVREAHQRNIPIAAVNHGKTRADDLIDIKIEAACGPTLARSVRLLDC